MLMTWATCHKLPALAPEPGDYGSPAGQTQDEAIESREAHGLTGLITMLARWSAHLRSLKIPQLCMQNSPGVVVLNHSPVIHDSEN